jgi:hypothetical protein
MNDREIYDAIYNDVVDIFAKYTRLHDDNEIVDGEMTVTDDALEYILRSVAHAANDMLEKKHQYFNDGVPSYTLN